MNIQRVKICAFLLFIALTLHCMPSSLKSSIFLRPCFHPISYDSLICQFYFLNFSLLNKLKKSFPRWKLYLLVHWLFNRSNIRPSKASGTFLSKIYPNCFLSISVLKFWTGYSSEDVPNRTSRVAVLAETNSVNELTSQPKYLLYELDN